MVIMAWAIRPVRGSHQTGSCPCLSTKTNIMASELKASLIERALTELVVGVQYYGHSRLD